MAQFTFETVDGSGAVAGQCSLALDGTGNPLIAYAGANGRLLIASRNSDTWVSEELTSAGATRPSSRIRRTSCFTI